MPQLQPPQDRSLLGYQGQEQPRNPYLDNIMAVLNDPRNQMMFAPGMALLKAPGAITGAARGISGLISGERGSFKPFAWLRKDSPAVQGGGQVPTYQMRRQMEDLEYGSFNDKEARDEYVKRLIMLNQLSRDIFSSNPELRSAARDVASQAPAVSDTIGYTTRGIRALEDEVRIRRNPASGGSSK